MRRQAVFAAAGAALLSCGPQGDSTPPRILPPGPVIAVVRDTTATVTWLTDERANSLVEYGPDTSYGTVEIDNLFLESHTVTIRNLLPQSNYHLRVLSYDLFGNGPARSDDFVITTLPPQPPPAIVITEVLYNPVSSSGDFIELYNDGFDVVDLNGFAITDYDVSTAEALKAFPGETDTELQPGEYAVVLESDYVDGTYTIPAGAVRMTTNDTTLGNGLSSEDPVGLFAPGGAVEISTYGTPLDAADGVPISTVPTGSGKSIERRDATQPDEAGNWCISIDVSGSTPGAPNSGC